MDDNFFDDPTPPQEYHPHSANQPQIVEDEFDFSDNQYQTQQDRHPGSYPNINPSSGINYGSQSNFEVDDQTTRRIREEEEKIQEQLRNKSNEQYEKKQERRERGRKLLQQFMDKKEQEKQERQRQNKEKQEKRKQQLRSMNGTEGWKKVAQNIALKQGEHPGKKQVNRMREAIVNKKNDN